MNTRQKKILATIIEEYTTTGLPVGSHVLVEKYGFAVSTATLRNDMVHLEEEGFLHQPHVSAGRMPTDKGYRYFVENVMQDQQLSKKEQQKMQKELLQLRARNVRLTRTTAKLLSVLSGNVAFSGMPEKNEFYEFGLRGLLQEAESEDIDELCRLAEVLDYIDERCDVLMRELPNDETKIFIGKENPISEISNYSMVVSPYHDKSGGRGIIALIGPKRMKYDKNKSLIDYVKKFLSTSAVIIIIISL